MAACLWNNAKNIAHTSKAMKAVMICFWIVDSNVVVSPCKDTSCLQVLQAFSLDVSFVFHCRIVADGNIEQLLLAKNQEIGVY